MSRIPGALPILVTAGLAFAGVTALVPPAGAGGEGPVAEPGAAVDAPAPRPQSMPTEAGQGAFAAISEIVAILDADPATDWSRVDIASLRDHLVDMNRVMVDAEVTQEPVDGGVRMLVGGPPAAVEAARRMVRSHTAMVAADRGWTVDVGDRGDALVVSWTTSRPDDVPRLRALGFYGFLAEGSHHQRHHLMIARGMNPHGGGL